MSTPQSDSVSRDAEPTSSVYQWLTAQEAAQYLQIQPRTLQLWARQGRVKAYALSGHRRHVWRFLLSDLDHVVEQKKPVVSSSQPSVLAHERSV